MPRTSSRSRGRAGPSSRPVHHRLIWVDVARCLALISMMLAHTAPTGGPGGVLNLTEHLTAALFAALVGVSARLEVQHLGIGRAAARAVIRALVLAACSWLVGFFGAQVHDILPHLAVVALLMGLLAALPLAAQLVLALLSGSGGVALVAQGTTAAVAALLPLADAVGLPADRLATGVATMLTDAPYRLPLLLAWALLGAVVLRTLHGTREDPARRMRVDAVWWAVGGAALAGVVLASSRARTGAMPVPYSGTVPEVLVDTGLVLLVLGLCAAVVPNHANPATELLSIPGAMTLSVYVAHHAYLGWVAHLAGPVPWRTPGGADDTWFNVVVLILGAIALPPLWRTYVRSRPWRAGPIEGVARLVTDRIGGR